MLVSLIALVFFGIGACSSGDDGEKLSTESKMAALTKAMMGASTASESDKDHYVDASLQSSRELGGRALHAIEWHIDDTYPNELGGSVGIKMDMSGTYDTDTDLERVTGTEIDQFNDYMVKVDEDTWAVTGKVTSQVTQTSSDKDYVSDSTTSGTVSIDGEPSDFDVKMHTEVDFTTAGYPSTTTVKGTLGGEAIDLTLNF